MKFIYYVWNIYLYYQVARYNSMQQNTQSMNIALSNSVLHRAKPEILSIVEHLIDKMHVEMKDLLVEVKQWK